MTKKAQIAAAQVTLCYARKLGDKLKIELAEATLNDLLDNYPHTYHRYHTSRLERK